MLSNLEKEFISSFQLSFVRVSFRSESSLIAEVKNSDNEILILKVRNSTNTLSITKEAKHLRRMSHPNIVTLKGCFEDQNFCALLLEKVPGSALIDFIKQYGPIKEIECRYIIKQMVSVMEYLLSLRIAHLDIKPDNIVYEPKSKLIKFIDFEYAHKWSIFRKTYPCVGTTEYRAPEVEKGKYKGTEADVWSLGVTLYVLLVGYYPELEKSKLKGEKFSEPTLDLSEQVKNLMSLMLDPNPKTRIKSNQILKHKWFPKRHLELIRETHSF